MVKPTFTTLPGLLNYVLQTFRNSNAFNYRRLGHWEHISTEEFVAEVRRLALGLKAIGVQPGDSFGIIVPPSPQWLMIDLAVMINGAVSVPMFPNVSPENFIFQMNDAALKFLFIKNANILAPPIVEKLKGFKKIIALDVETQGDNVMNYCELLSRGDEVSSEAPELFTIMRDIVTDGDLATIIYTSGTSGVPKGARITHKNLVSQIYGARERFPLSSSQDVVLSCLPLAHVFERMAMYFYLSSGVSVFFADDVKKVGDILREIHPTVMTLVPRLLEKVHAKMHGNISELHGLKKKLAESAFKFAETADPEVNGLRRKIFNRLIFKKLRAALGGKLRLVICGSAKLPEDIERFFMNIGLPLYQGYGLTECSPVVSANYPGMKARGTVGKPFPNVQVKIDESGEILVKSPGVFEGYHNNNKATSEMIDKDGWLHTGDLGKIDESCCVVITGRKKELFKTSNGKYVSPAPIEQAAAQNELIDMATVIAEGKRFVSMLLFPDFESLPHIREMHGHNDMTDEEYLNSPEVQHTLEHLVENINKKLNHWEQIRKFELIHKPLTIDDGELTPTMKVRRHVVQKEFADVINRMYRE